MHLDLVNLLAVMVAAWAGGRLATRLGYPSVLGEILAGILLGPAALGLVEDSAALSVLAELGVLLMMLYIGMEIDPAELERASWGGLLAALGGFLAPFLLCFGLARWWGGDLLTALFIGIAAGVTSLAVNSRILVDLSIMGTRLAHVLMAGALVTDTLCLVALSIILGAAQEGGVEHLSLGALATSLGRAALFFAVTGVAGLYLLPRQGGPLLRFVARGSRTAGFTLALTLAVAVAWLAELLGLHGLVGAFIAGMFLRERSLGREMAAQLRHIVHDASIGFLAPIFFVTTGFAVSFRALRGDLSELLLLVLLATVGKVAGTLLAYLATGRGWREGLVLGAAMNGRGAVEIIVAGIALDAGIIDERLFSMLVFLAILTTATVPLTLRWGVAWLRRRGELVAGRESRRGVVVVGAGRTARELARVLGQGRPLCLVDSSVDHCREAREEGLEALRGSALDLEVLEAAGAASAALVVAATSNASVNALVARLARQHYGVPEVIVALADPEEGADALRHLGAALLFGRGVCLVEWDQRLRDGEVAAAEVAAESVRSLSGDEVLPLAVVGPEGPRPFLGRCAVAAGERLVVLAVRRAHSSLALGA